MVAATMEELNALALISEVGTANERTLRHQLIPVDAEVSAVAVSPDQRWVAVGDIRGLIRIYDRDQLFNFSSNSEPVLTLSTADCEVRADSFLSEDWACSIRRIGFSDNNRALDVMLAEGTLQWIELADPAPVSLTADETIIGAGMRGGVPVIAVRSGNVQTQTATCRLSVRVPATGETLLQREQSCRDAATWMDLSRDGRSAVGGSGWRNEASFYRLDGSNREVQLRPLLCGAAADPVCGVDPLPIPLTADGRTFLVSYLRGAALISTADGSIVRRITDDRLRASQMPSHGTPSLYVSSAHVLDDRNYVIGIDRGGSTDLGESS